MKKIILSAIAVMAFGFANAQDVKFGVKAGVNFANLGGDTEDTKALVGFQVGGFAEIKLTEKFAIQPELLYSTQGAKNEDSFGGETYKYDSKFDYLNVPVMAKYFVTKGLSVEAGPQIGFLLSAKEDGEDAKDYVKSIDFGANFGVGYDFTENISAGIRYNLGLSNINDSDSSDDYKVNNNVFSLTVGYKF